MTTTRPLVPVEDEILHELRAHVAQRSTTVRRRRRLTQGIGVAAAAAVAAVVGATALTPQAATAADVLNDAANAAADAPATSGTYWRVETRAENGDRTVTWQSKDGHSWIADGNQAPIAGRGPYGFYLCENQVSYAQLTALPTDPDALSARLTDALSSDSDAVADPNAGVATCLTGLLFDVPAPPSVRAAAFRALVDAKAIDNRGAATDRQGRHGTELRFTDNGTVSDVIVDQDSGALLQYDQSTSDKSSGETITAGWTDTPPAS